MDLIWARTLSLVAITKHKNFNSTSWIIPYVFSVCMAAKLDAKLKAMGKKLCPWCEIIRNGGEHVDMLHPWCHSSASKSSKTVAVLWSRVWEELTEEDYGLSVQEVKEEMGIALGNEPTGWVIMVSKEEIADFIDEKSRKTDLDYNDKHLIELALRKLN